MCAEVREARKKQSTELSVAILAPPTSSATARALAFRQRYDSICRAEVEADNGGHLRNRVAGSAEYWGEGRGNTNDRGRSH